MKPNSLKYISGQIDMYNVFTAERSRVVVNGHLGMNANIIGIK